MIATASLGNSHAAVLKYYGDECFDADLLPQLSNPDCLMLRLEIRNGISTAGRGVREGLLRTFHTPNSYGLRVNLGVAMAVNQTGTSQLADLESH